MNRVLFFILFVLPLSSKTFAQREVSGFRNLLMRSSLHITGAEGGIQYRLSTQKENYGSTILKAYTGSKIKGPIISFLGIGYCYNKQWEVGVMPFYCEMYSNENGFLSYIDALYPNHFIVDAKAQRTTTYKGLGIYTSYRKTIHQVQLEARLQFFPGVYQDQEESFYLKEIASNQYISYAIREEVTKSSHAYQAGIGVCLPFNWFKVPFKSEIGVNTGLFFAPVQSRFTFSEQPYGQETLIQEVVDFSMNAHFYWSVRMRFLIGQRD